MPNARIWPNIPSYQSRSVYPAINLDGGTGNSFGPDNKSPESQNFLNTAWSLIPMAPSIKSLPRCCFWAQSPPPNLEP